MSASRTSELVRENLGSVIRELLCEPDIMDIIVRPDWVAVDRARSGLESIPRAIGTVRTAELLRLLGPLVGIEVPHQSAIVELALPGYGARFAGVYLGAKGEESFFTIRRAVVHGLTLDHYLATHALNDKQHQYLSDVIDDPMHGILIAGATASGKTTMLATLLHEVVERSGKREHLVVVEDTPEIVLSGPMVTSIVSTLALPYRTALRAALRHRPTRLIVGEVRGGEALDAVKAGATGHGLMMTIHANTLEGAVRTLLARMSEGTDGRVDEQLVPDALRTVMALRKIDGRVQVHDIGILRSLSPLHIERV